MTFVTTQDENRSGSTDSALPPDPFHRSLFLHERAVPKGELPEEALQAARQRMDAWSEASGADAESFCHRLEVEGLDEESFLRILAAHEAGRVPEARDPGSHAWYRVVEEIRRGTHDDLVLHEVRWRNPDGSEGTEPPFSSFLKPFLRCGVARLRSGLAAIQEDHGGPPLVSPQVEVQFQLELTEQLTKQFSSTLILELNVARLRGQLEGETPTARFRHFSERFFDRPRILEMLEEYPVLARLLSLIVLRWSEARLEFLARLAADRSSLGTLMGGDGEPPGTLRQVQLGVSDLHRGGRSVVIAEDGEGRRIVYKPTSLAVDLRMAAVIREMNRLGLRHPLRAVEVLDRGDYGWLRFVEARDCGSAEALHRFYWRQGSLIALLHLVRGADFHHENLIASGEHPVLVDHEALFHQHRPWSEEKQDPRFQAGRDLVRSVLRQALLPFVQRLSGSGEGVDSSGLGGAGGQVARGTVVRWARAGTDEMHVAPADLVTTGSRNRPTLDGEVVDASRYLPDLVQGFRETYDLMAAHRRELGPLLDAFAGCGIRFLVRPTRLYTVFLREARHPNDLRDGLERDELLDRLWAWTAAGLRLRQVVPHEHADLRTGDVPVFQTYPESTHLWSSDGQRIDDFFHEPMLDEARRILDDLSEEDRERQAELIRLTVSEGASRSGTAPPAPPTEAREPAGADAASDDARLVEAAVQVGRILKRRVLRVGEEAFWMSLDPFVDDRPGGDRSRNVALAGVDLYHGGAGIALFLAHLGALTGDAEATELARGTVRGLLRERKPAGAGPAQASGPFLGRGSTLYALLHLAVLWSEPELLEEALRDLPDLAAVAAGDEELDLVAGNAGLAAVLLRLHRATGEAAPLRLARDCADHVLREARPVGSGLAWTGHSFDRPVAGFAHGAAGIAWALSEMGAATGDERYADAARRGIAFERELLASDEGVSFHARVSWCHGLPSVAVGRLATPAALDDLRYREEVEAGMERILGPEAPTDACLCHGILGNAQILDLAGRRYGVDRWRRAARQAAISEAARVGDLEGDRLLPLHGRFAGLMCGLAGVGLGLLRFAHGDRIPSVLTLETAPAVAPGRPWSGTP